MLRLSVFFLFIAMSWQASALTFKSGGTISSSQNNSAKGSNQLLVDVVTQKRKASELTDEELCETLKSMDLLSTYYEMKDRGLKCLQVDKVSKNWEQKTPEEAFRFLRGYQNNYDVIIPKYSLDGEIKTFGNVEQTFATFKELNPEFKNMFSDIGERENFCLDWYPQVATIYENQTKNLDGSTNWNEGTLSDGFVLCQDSFNKLIYTSLFDVKTRDKVKLALENWIDSDTPHRQDEYDGAFFLYTHLINKMLIAIEILHQDFDWDDAYMAKAKLWAKNRVLEMFPGDRKKKYSRLPLKCEIKYTSNEKKSEVCQNGGILQAQALLRAGIFSKDKELIDMSYLAFHRYMSGIREDGSNAADSTRGCTAAGYNIWASQFMSDYIYLWSQIGEPLWSHSSFNRGTPSQAVEYSLSLYGNWEKINKYTLDSWWEGCGEDKKQRTQMAGTRYGGKYSKISFAPYFAHSDIDRLVDALANYDRTEHSLYTKQSGIAYEAAIIFKNTDIISAFSKKRKEVYLANIPPALKKLGVMKNISGRYIKIDSSFVKLADPVLKDYRPPKKVGWPARYKIKFETLRDAGLNLDRQTITFWQSSNELTVQFWLEDLFEEYADAKEDWNMVFDKCGKFVEDNEFYDLQIPIISDWRELNEQFECVAENVSSTETAKLIGLLTYAANHINLESFRP